MSFFRLLYLVLILLFFSCGNNTAKSIQQQEINQEFNIENLQVRALPLVDSTSFDNFNFADTLNQVQIQRLKLDEKFDSITVFYLNYRIELSENFTSLVVSYEWGYELFTVLINYDKDFRIVDILHIAFDEVAESWSRKLSTINTDKIIVKKFNYIDYYIDRKAVLETSVYKIDADGRFHRNYELCRLRHMHLEEVSQTPLVDSAGKEYRKYRESKEKPAHYNKNAKFETLFLKYDKIRLMVATLYISPYFREMFYKMSEMTEMSTTLDDGWFAFELAEFYNENANSLEMDKHLTDCDFASIERWFLMDEKLFSVPVSRDEGVGVEFAQIIFYMKNGEKLYNQFINRSIGQWWGSLSARQSGVFLYNVLYYLTFADSDAVEAFFIDYFETFQKLTENPLFRFDNYDNSIQ